MALIQCHECQREVSDTAETCPGCGTIVASQTKVDSANRKLAGLLFFAPILYLTVIAMIFGPDEFAHDWRWAKWIIAAGAAYYIVVEVVRGLRR